MLTAPRYHASMRIPCLALVMTLSTAPAVAAELVLFEYDGCLWCEEWKRDVGVYYAETAEGKMAPLRIVDLLDRRPADLRHIRPVRATPTFVLVEDGRELGRITGYTDAREFWTDFSAVLEDWRGR